jgi:hypothetical protein
MKSERMQAAIDKAFDDLVSAIYTHYFEALIQAESPNMTSAAEATAEFKRGLKIAAEAYDRIVAEPMVV